MRVLSFLMGRRRKRMPKGQCNTPDCTRARACAIPRTAHVPERVRARADTPHMRDEIDRDRALIAKACAHCSWSSRQDMARSIIRARGEPAVSGATRKN